MPMSNLDLGLIGNCQVGVLVDSRGRFVWGCFPRFDGDPAFCSLLGGDAADAAAGFFDIELLDLEGCEQSYEGNTPVLITRLYDHAGGCIRIEDFVPRFEQFGRTFRPIMVIRHITPLSGSPTIRIRLRPASQYGAKRPDVTFGSNHIRFLNDAFTLRLTTNAPLTSVLEERALVLEDPVSLILGADETIPEHPSKVSHEMLSETRRYWARWVRGLSLPFEWQDEVIRAAITLKLCTYEDTGAVLAALTTSIPEAPDSGRNWDYRFCWLRDSFYVVKALNRLGATKTMEAFLRYLNNIVVELGSPDQLQPVYGITGRSRLEEHQIETLPGYRGMGPVRVGNQAYRQTQNDVYGAVVLAATQQFFDRRLARKGGRQEFQRLEALGGRAVELFEQPDAGLWEYRGRQRVHTYSSVMCWAACDRLARIALHLRLADRAAYWARVAGDLHRRIYAAAWSEDRASFVGSFGDDAMDASLLTLADLGFVGPGDPRFQGTLRAVEEDLRRGPYVFRYASADDFGMPATAFNICTFWYIDALAAAGRGDEARELFCNMLERRNSLGLLSEDLDPATGELWGNFPQTYSMVGLISSATRLSRSWEEAL